MAAVIRNKRNKVSASGAYASSSNQDTEEAREIVCHRPQGQKAAKEQRKGKAGKGRLSSDNVGQFNNPQARKSEAIENMAAATREHAQALVTKAAAGKEKVRMKKIKKFT